MRITEDVAENIVAVSFGQGHKALGRSGTWRGANVFEAIDTTDSASMFGKATIKKTGKKLNPVYLTATQHQHQRELMQWIELSEASQDEAGRG